MADYMDRQKNFAWSNINNDNQSSPGLAYTYSRSSRRSTPDLQGSRASDVQNVYTGNARLATLADFVLIVAGSNVRGPIHLTEPNLQSREIYMAEGGQWQVFSDAHTMSSYVIKRVKPVPSLGIEIYLRVSYSIKTLSLTPSVRRFEFFRILGSGPMPISFAWNIDDEVVILYQLL